MQGPLLELSQIDLAVGTTDYLVGSATTNVDQCSVGRDSHNGTIHSYKVGRIMR